VLPLADDALDARHSVADGEVLGTADTGIHVGGTDFVRVDYRFFTNEGAAQTGHSFLPPRRGLEPGASIRIEYLADAPDVSRVRGSTRNPLGSLWTVLLGALAMPAFLLTLWWLRGAMRLRLLLSSGRAVSAEVLEQRTVFGVNPPQWNVRFRFLDDRGREHEAAHWVGQGSPLGRDLAAGATTVSVVHDEADPASCRLAHPTDFVT
jgi:hypothetical protein